MENILKKLLDDLAAIAADDHDEIFDTDVREQMSDAIWSGFINPQGGYELPDTFGMFSDDGNERIKAALEEFLPAAGKYARENGISTPQERLDAFQNENVAGGDEYSYDDFFGYLESAEDYVQ